MYRIAAIYRREFSYFFNSPVAYAVITVFLILAGYFFYNLLGYFNLLSIQVMQNPVRARALNLTDSVVGPLLGNMSTILMLILPLLTMRLLSEERRAGTAELLFTYPISDWDAVLGKYFATITVFIVMLVMTMVYPAVLTRYTDPEPGPLITGYLGLFLMGSSFVAMGLFFSSLSESQMVAGVSTFGCGLLFLVVGWIAPFVSPVVASVLEQLSILEHFQGFARGVIDTTDVVYYLNVIVFFLFMSVRVLDSNRWRS